jgi:hypothetical protein
MQLEDTPDPAQPDDGIGVLVHAQIDLRIGLAAEHDYSGGLLPRLSPHTA